MYCMLHGVLFMARHRFRIGLALVLLLLFNAIPTAFGTDAAIIPQEPKGTRGTIVVNASGGGDYMRIQWAIDNASEGDTVYVEAGTYNETIEIDKSITLTGESQDRTTITGEGRIVNVSADGVSVSGFTVTGSTVAYEGIGIYLENVENCNVSGNNCSNNSYCGIALWKTSHTTITNNVCSFEGTEYGSLDATRGIGISSLYSSDNVIDANTCDNNTWCGIMLNNSWISTISNNVCRNNGGRPTSPNGYPTNRKEFGTGIYLIYSNNNSIHENYCNNSFRIVAMSGICSGIALISSHDNIVKDNMLYYAADYGVLLSGSKRCRIQDNYCIGGWRGAVYISGGKHNVIFRNHLPEYAITIISSYNIISHNLCENDVMNIWFGSSNNSIIGNTIRNSSYGGMYLDYEPGEWFDTNFSRIHHNNFINNTNYHLGQAEDWGKYNTWNDSFGEGNYWSDYAVKYPNAMNDGNVWNHPYEVYGDNDAKDYYPLVNPIEEGEYYPAAMIGPPFVIDQHETIYFSGSHSFDCLGIVNYTWDLDDNGKHIRLFGILPEYTFHDAGTFRITLTITNTQGNRDAATSTITVRDAELPVANAGPDATIELHKGLSVRW